MKYTPSVIYITRVFIFIFFAGIGWAVVLIAFYTDFFYNVVIAWALHFFFASFTGNLPWDSCNNDWNTDHCYDGLKEAIGSDLKNATNNVTKVLVNNKTEDFLRVSPAHEYFEYVLLFSSFL